MLLFQFHQQLKGFLAPAKFKTHLDDLDPNVYDNIQ